MKNFTVSLIILLIGSNLYSQELPNNLTNDEIVLLKTYVHPLSGEAFTDPPNFEPRTMAEWEELDGLLITWRSFTYILSQVVDYAQEEGTVYIVCNDSNSVKNYLTSFGIPLHNLEYLIEPSNSIWCRDYGPWSIYADYTDSLSFVDWIYNRPRPWDDIIPAALANYLDLPIYQTTTPPYDLVNTGGNFIADGHGTGFSSELVLTENPGKTPEEIDLIMNAFMGIDRYIKMEVLPYDAIHHIDMHMKLLDEETLLVGEYPPGVADGPQIEANLQYILTNFETCFGREYDVVRIPMPPDQFGLYPNNGGDYRTYTNSIIINKTVIVPIYEEQYDTTALRIYREAMPGYNIVGIDCNQIIPSYGAIHCIVKEIGKNEPIFISHAKIREVENLGPYEVRAFIQTPSGIANASVFWSNDTASGYQLIQMTQTVGDTFIANIPQQSPDTEVYYYLSSVSNSGLTINKPIVGSDGPYKFIIPEEIPVELISFTASLKNRHVLLREWSTATETNNAGFEIERTTPYPFPFCLGGQAEGGSVGDGGGWEIIAFIEGKGTTTEIQNYSFEDKNLESGILFYRLNQIDFDGTRKSLAEVEVGHLPNEFILEQNFPNPFNPSTTITYTIPKEMNVDLKVYDVLGNVVAELVDDVKKAGRYDIIFDASALGGLASGFYFYILKSGNFASSKKMLLLK